MIRVAFTIIDGKTSWMGGINYLKNLLFAISKVEDRLIYPILFVGNKTDEKLVKQFEGLAEIVRDSLFDRLSSKWLTYTIMRDIFRKNLLINNLIEKHNVDIFSHSYVYGPDIKCITANWIPDFQHLRLPHLYSKLHLGVRDYRLRSLAKYSDLVLLSSYDALTDYEKFAPDFIQKTRVIHFVSQTSTVEDAGVGSLMKKYEIGNKYFFLPNQFWTHKNHIVAFKAILLAKEKQPDIVLLCSGLLNDPRNMNYIKSLQDFIEQNKLHNNIKLLGLIPFNDVLLFMKHSLAIINPSYFEGWSSTVEESKSMKKDLILSDIPVHHEQVPSGGSFFNADDAVELSSILLDKWYNFDGQVKESEDKNELLERTIEFGTKFQSIVVNAKRID